MTALERRYAALPEVVVAAPAAFAAIVPELIERRRRGQRVVLALDVEEPRVALLRTVAPQFLTGTDDERAVRLDALAAGKLSVNGAAQPAAEEAWYGTDALVPFAHACAIADEVVFRSSLERERCARLFRERPSRSTIAVPPDDRVPPPPAAPPAAGEHIALWTEDVAGELVDAAAAMLWDLRTPVRLVNAATPDAGSVLAAARAIVALDPSDPAAALALAAYGVPLCVTATCGAAESLDGAGCYDPWARVGLVDAVLRALGAAPPRVRCAATIYGAGPAVPVRVVDRAPPVSIVIATWNRPHLLRECLEQLREQTYPNVETIVVNNNGCPVGDVVAAFPNAALIDRNVNSGDPTVPRNDGLARARGAFVAFLDDDDLYFPDHVSANVDALERRGAACAKSDFFVRIVERAADGREVEIGWDLERNPGITRYELLVANRIGYMTVFARREALLAAGGFDVDSGAPELDLWTRLAARWDVVHLDRPTAVYTIRVDWAGTATALLHGGFGDAYATYYRRHPATGLPHVLAAREQYLAHLRAQAAPPPRAPRYPALARAATR